MRKKERKRKRESSDSESEKKERKESEKKREEGRRGTTSRCPAEDKPPPARPRWSVVWPRWEEGVRVREEEVIGGDHVGDNDEDV